MLTNLSCFHVKLEIIERESDVTRTPNRHRSSYGRCVMNRRDNSLLRIATTTSLGDRSVGIKSVDVS